MPAHHEFIEKSQQVEGSNVPRVESAGDHTHAKDFLGRVSLAAEKEGRPLRAVYNGYEFEVDGKVEPHDLDQAYRASVLANKREIQPSANSTPNLLKRAA